MSRACLSRSLAFSCVLVAGALPVQGFQMEIPARQVAAPAADILAGRFDLPELTQHAVRSGAAMIPIEWDRSRNGAWLFETSLPLGAGPLGVAWALPGAGSLRLQMHHSQGQIVDLESQAARSEFSEACRYDLAQVQAGLWTFRLEAPVGASEPMGGFLVVRDSQALIASAHLTSHERVSDRSIGIQAQLELDSGLAFGPPLPLAANRVLVSFKDESQSGVLEMFDDGAHGDGAASDGRFGAWLPAGMRGQVEARIAFSGRWQGQDFLRNTALRFAVAEPLLEVTGEVHTEVEDARRLRIDIEAWPLSNARRVIVAAEVWGRDAWGQEIPIAWLSRVEEPQETSKAWHLPLWLDTAWLGAAQASPPLELRAVRIQDPDHHALLAQAEVLQVPHGPLPPLAGRWEGRVTWEMLSGAASTSTQAAGPATPINPVAVQPGLMLVHGYCSGGNVWPNPDFSQPKLQFSDLGQNRSHDQFAQLIAQQGAGFTSFGVIGHSQGGQAALHLLTFYQSPLDQAGTGRRIQSVGSPYQGTPLASLGFFACGVNDNMTTAGASTWLANIPSWARAEVSYWTTSNSGSACNFFTNLLLANPEDGTTEQFRGQLPGGNNMGHVTGWCHTTGMSEPAQYTDAARNFEMNLEAAR